MDTGHKRRELQRRNKLTTYAFWKPILSQDISAQGYLLCSRETQVASGKMVLHLYGLRTHCKKQST